MDQNKQDPFTQILFYCILRKRQTIWGFCRTSYFGSLYSVSWTWYPRFKCTESRNTFFFFQSIIYRITQQMKKLRNYLWFKSICICVIWFLGETESQLVTSKGRQRVVDEDNKLTFIEHLWDVLCIIFYLILGTTLRLKMYLIPIVQIRKLMDQQLKCVSFWLHNLCFILCVCALL